MNDPDVLNITPASTTITVTTHPALPDPEAFQRRMLDAITNAPSIPEPSPREHVIPVCYEPGFAPDLDNVCRLSGMRPQDIVSLHSSGPYTVEFIGFTPGFGYLTGLPQPLMLPRLEAPRTRVPEGSVGLAGPYTGIYPHASPGGWRLIGRTPIAMFDQNAARPSRLAIGDIVRFRAISSSEFEHLAPESH